MSRRATLPGAAELFRATAAPVEPVAAPSPAHPGVGAMPAPGRGARRIRPVAERGPSGRERHAEKITVYCSPEELVDIEAARLALRAEHGLAVDRGRIVREAVAVVLADLDAKGEASILVRRLRQPLVLSAEDSVEIEALAIEPVGAEPGTLAPDPTASDDAAFHVRLDNFEGPFDLLLSLITRRQLDITEIALSQVTDEFLSFLAGAATWDLGQVTGFLVVAATLLDLKTARLLPAAEVEDDEDLALLEARDLLFARLLQYRAYKLAAAYLGELERTQGRRYGRSAELEPRFAQLLPEVLIGVPPDRFADLAALALTPRPVPTVAVDHVHAPKVSVREQMAILRTRLQRAGSATFRSLVADCASTLEVVGRFLGLLELYRDGVVAFDQAAALTELRVRWTGGTGSGDGAHDDADDTVDDTVDEEYG